MSLKNTDYIYGLVIYTGHETKVMKNSAESKYKKSRLDLFTDYSVKMLFVIQIIFTFCVGTYAFFPYRSMIDTSDDPNSACRKELDGICTADVAAGNYTDMAECVNAKKLNKCGNAWYLEIHGEPGFGTVVRISLTWILLFVNLVPLSLIISLEMVKYF